jgi:type IV pilus assembly protein PilE
VEATAQPAPATLTPESDPAMTSLPSTPWPRRRPLGARPAGFTLIELLIALLIIGILAAIAYPSYAEQVRRSQRAEAQTVLMEAAQYLQRHYAARNSYSDAELPFTQSPKDGTRRYSISVAAEDQSYVLTAAPVATDVRCGSLTLTETGQRGVSTGTVADCWR